MHLETLKTFCDLVETGSLSRAARLNRVTQSAVSQQLKALERRYGCTLVDRAPRVAARPTEAGRLLYLEVKGFLARFEEVEERLRAARPDVVAGTVRVATVYSVGLHTLPPVMKASLRAHPQLRVALEYRRTDQVYAACLAGEVDLGIVALPARRPSLEVIPLRGDELVVVAPPDHPLARRRSLPLAALDGQPFIAFDRDIPTRRLIDRVLRARRVAVTVVMELDNIETIKRSVEAGLGLSILPAPALASEVRARSLVARRPADGKIERAIGAIRRRGREPSSAARAFLASLTAELGA
jgi:LysR family transcriptional regulator, transcriptional activator of the cysJI operon